MPHLSRLFRLRKRRFSSSSKPARRRHLLAGFEPLEDRRVLAVSVSFSAGVLTFTGDPNPLVADSVVIESTGTAGTVNYNGGLGSISQAGVNSVVFNAGAGDNEFIIINQAPSRFAPAAGAFFDIFYNVSLDGVGDDSLRLAGGSAATITSGTYDVLSPNSGRITYTTPTTGIRVEFSGIDSAVDEVDDETIQAGAFVTNTSSGAESVTVKVGPVLTPVQSFTRGPVIVDGGDREDHGSGLPNTNGWKFMEQGIGFVKSQVFNSGAANSILIVGTSPGSQARNAVNSAISPLGLAPTYITGAAISTVNFNAFRILYVPSDAGDVSGGISNADLALLAARTADIQTFVKGGGGIYAQTEATAAVPYSWLQIPDPFTITSFGGGGISNPLRKTAQAIAAGFTISDAELSAGVPYHNVFTGPAGFNGLDIFVLDTGPNNVVDGFPPAGDDRAVTLGQGAINQSVGGGPTTQISGNQMVLINLGNKLSLNLNTLGGTDSILVDGSTLSLDGLLAPLTINGGGNGDSLSITDSADNTGPGDNVSVTSLATTGLAAFAINYLGIGSLSVQATQGADTMTLDFSAAGPTTVTIFGGAGGDTFTGPTGYMRASSSIQINVHGDTAAKTTGPVNPGSDAPLSSPDKFNLDMTTRADGAAVTPVVIVDTNGGNATSSNTQLVRFTGIENVDVLDNGVLADTEIGDFFLRGTAGPDYILFVSAGQVNPTFRVRVGNVYYPSTGSFGPYLTATGQVYVYGGGGNDTISMYNTRLDGVLFGEGGDDILTGGYGNDLLIGGQGNDRLNGGTVGGNDEIWGDDYDPVADAPLLAAGNPATHPANRAGGNDQINSFGGNDRIYGQGGNDIINSGGGDDYINGGPGDDTIDGQAGHDRIYGGDGNDVISGSDGNDLLVGGAGNDFLYGRTGDDVLIGGLGADMLNGHEGGDLLQGDDDANSGSLHSGDARDVALMALLLSQWVPFKTTANLTPVGNDGSTDTLWGGAHADLFFVTGLDLAADKNAPGYGPDL